MLVEMGYSRELVLEALEECDQEYGRALVFLLTRGLPDQRNS